MDEEAEDVGAVVDGDRDHAMPGHVRAVVPRLRAVAVLEAAAEDVNQDGQFLSVRLRRSPDVEVEAVLAHAAAAEPVVGAGTGPLHAPGAELVGIADARSSS